ncbi:MAG TPA: GIDE domain-containing protein [Pseudomonas sp.]|uniref:GIDE domain-containing protein n=1 Tax=Pseudomonas sp. TaxID=306 RepID=UPI002B72044B|nr:GIDE domain-containing protein [Pseudomonas sp.]HRL92554.1 GIDE domain-containing protein [Pseudomonas sp.]
MEIDGLVVALAASVGACVGGGWWAVRRMVQARYLLDTPTSKIRSAAQGYVELYGVLQEHKASLQARLTGKPCLWWRFKVEEYSSSDKRSAWRVVESGSSEACFLLSDGTGECLVDPKGAEIRPATKEVWQSDQAPLTMGSGGLFDWFSSGKQYRYTEERLHAGEPLYAIGDFHTRGGGQQGLDLSAAQGTVIREWKGDYGRLLERFDSDGNQQLDESEWNRVRLAAQLEAEDRHSVQSLQPAQHQMGKPSQAQPFILSSHGEDQLARQFYWQALAGGVVCLLGALALTWLLRNALP